MQQNPRNRNMSTRRDSNERTGTKGPNLFFDTKKSVFFKQNPENIIYQVTSLQMPVLKYISLDDIFLSQNHILEPHWHPNAAELDYVVKGELIISVLDPLTPQLLTYRAKPHDVVFIPKNWWHWIIAVSDEAHVIAVYDTEKRENMFGSDMLRKTPPEVFELAYGIDAEKLAKILAPITGTVIIGPKNNAVRNNELVIEMVQPRNRMRERYWGPPPSSLTLFFNTHQNVNFRRDAQNVLYEVTETEIPLMNDLSLGDLYLSRDHIREPHWHPNADEFDYIAYGEVTISILNPSTLELQTYNVKTGQVTFIPKGWWHWITAVTEEAHLIVNFNDGKIQSIEGSDVLRFTPPAVFELAYDVNAHKLEKVLAPIDETIVIGPPDEN